MQYAFAQDLLGGILLKFRINRNCSRFSLGLNSLSHRFATVISRYLSKLGEGLWLRTFWNDLTHSNLLYLKCLNERNARPIQKVPVFVT